MIYRNHQVSLIQCGDIVRGIEMVGDVVVHDWISLSDRSKDFLVSMFKAYSNMELKVTYMCFMCGMTGRRCEDCHYLCISDVLDDSDYAIEISFCYEDGMKVNLFFKKVYERKSLVWRCWMSRSGYGIVRIFKQKFFPKLFGFIKELFNGVHMIHKEMFHSVYELEDEGECENDNPEIVCTCGYHP